MNIPKVIFVLGAPGSGKGTQCLKLVQSFGFVHLSAGDLLREEQSRVDSEFGAIIKDRIANGKLVPTEITFRLLENAMEKATGNRFLVDGFPRSSENLLAWEQYMSHKVHFLFVLYLDCDEERCIERCLNRGQGRVDDNHSSIKKRFDVYKGTTMPIIEHYQKLGKLKQIDSNAEPDVVFQHIKAIIDESAHYTN